MREETSIDAVSWQELKKGDPVIVAGKDQGEVDNDYLLIPVNILDHEGPLSTTFPIENRLLPQGEVTCMLICLDLIIIRKQTWEL